MAQAAAGVQRPATQLALQHSADVPHAAVVGAHAGPGSHVPVPGLLFQPLIENAVRYAVAPRAEGGTVTLRVRRDPAGDTLSAEIADDGPGFAPGVRPSGNGVGLESVRERLRHGGPGHRFELESTPGSGTRVRITLPITPTPNVPLATALAAAASCDEPERPARSPR